MIAIINYGAGNTASVGNALNIINAAHITTNKIGEIDQCDKIILPGVGEASYTVKNLKQSGLFEYLQNTDKPLLGICLGMQLLGARSEEGPTECLNILPLQVYKFDSAKARVPQMGWNRIKINQSSKLLNGVKDGEFFYYANSFYMPQNEYSTASSIHGIEFCASLEKNNFYGVQFHPEKSGRAGLKILQNFINL